jgi:hypothetical protein
MKKINLLILLACMSFGLHAAPITYYDLDFEDGTLGGGLGFLPFALPSNVSSSNLDGNALEFHLDSQLVWNINDVDSPFHYVGFDFFANPGANVTQFLDVPRILRTDTDVPGRHRFEILYDFANERVDTYLDGVLNNSFVSATFWSTPSSADTLRIANQVGSPGLSTGTFQIDNLLWMGDDTAFRVTPASAPSGLALFLLASIGLLSVSRRYSK